MNLINEAEVNYYVPWKDDEKCPCDMTEYRYQRWKDKKECGTQRIFVLGRQPIDFYRLLERWNNLGQGSGWFYNGLP